MMSTIAPTRARLSFVDWLRLQDYFMDFDLWMSDYPRREYRKIARSLRAEVRAAAGGVGMKQALKDLGTPRRLAAGYLAEIVGRRPRWLAGGIAAAFALWTPFVAMMLFTIGSMSTLQTKGGGSVTLAFLGAHVEHRFSDSAIGWGVTLGLVWWAWVLTFTVLVFLLASRAWRALPGV